ncbi:peptidylprolyl isomerase [candidate division KSB1 bacterium]|nr:peptidylprolyl isomerase [candidate division KSB1 bacterium]
MLEFRQDAEDVLNQLKAGKTFEEMAQLKSIHPTAPKGGDLGFFRKGDFNEKFETAIFALQANQVSGIVEITLENKTYFCIFKRVQ